MRRINKITSFPDYRQARQFEVVNPIKVLCPKNILMKPLNFSSDNLANQINKFLKQWQNKEPQACKCLKKYLGNHLRYYKSSARIRDKLKSTNALEKDKDDNKERIGYFQNQKDLELFIFSY